MAKKAAQSKKPTEEDKSIGLVRALVDQFCRTHLNEEYRTTCLALTDKLARKRPSPLLSGKPNSWASGIVRAVGWANFLDDPSQKPHLRTSEIDKALILPSFKKGMAVDNTSTALSQPTLKTRVET